MYAEPSAALAIMLLPMETPLAVYVFDKTSHMPVLLGCIVTGTTMKNVWDLHMTATEKNDPTEIAVAVKPVQAVVMVMAGTFREMRLPSPS